MSQYYFTISSLPYLLYTHKPPVAFSEFESTCRNFVGEKDLQQLKRIRLSSPEKADGENSVIRKWKTWEINLRNELTRLRAKVKGVDGAVYLKEADEDFSATLVAAMAIEEDSPIKGEEHINRLRWQFLESMEIGHVFDLSGLVIYSLKLQILERKFSFEDEKGKEKYKNIMDGFNNSINSWESSYGK